jgi:hypothetical protein
MNRKKMDLAVGRPVLMFEGGLDDGFVIYLDLIGQDAEHFTWTVLVNQMRVSANRSITASEGKPIALSPPVSRSCRRSAKVKRCGWFNAHK